MEWNLRQASNSALQQDAGTGEDSNPLRTCWKFIEIWSYNNVWATWRKHHIRLSSTMHMDVGHDTNTEKYWCYIDNEDTLIQSPMTCASSFGAKSTFPATMWNIQEHKTLWNMPSNFDPKKKGKTKSTLWKLQNFIIFSHVIMLERMSFAYQIHSKI